MIITGVDIPEMSLFLGAVDSTEIGLQPIEELEMFVVVEFNAV